LYLLVNHGKTFKSIIWSASALGIGMSLVCLGQTRSGLMICLVNAAVALFFYIRRCKDKSPFKILVVKTLLLLGVSLAIFIIGLSFIPLEKSAEMVDDKTQTSAQVNEHIDSNILERLTQDEGENDDNYASGRLTLWKNYSRYLNLLGNNFDETDWGDMTGNQVCHAHNNLLEIGYRSGIITAIFFIIAELVAGIIALIYLFRSKKTPLAFLFPIMFMVNYTVMSMLDIATLPMERDAACYFYLITLMPIFARGERDIGIDT